MADRTAQGKPVDERTQRARKRNIEYEIRSQELSLLKQQNQILDAEDNLNRLRESVASLEERITIKKVELLQLGGGEEVNG